MLGPLLADPPIVPSSLDTGCGVNLRDGIAEGDAATALQFTTVMADCRLFYVPGDALNVSYPFPRWFTSTYIDKGLANHRLLFD